MNINEVEKSQDLATVSVCVPINIYHCLTYTIDPDINVVAGTRVKVTVGKRQLVGIVVDKPPHANSTRTFRLKPVVSVIDSQPVFQSEIYKLLKWSADYYQYPLGLVLSHALPAILRKGEPAQQKYQPVWRVNARHAEVNLDEFSNAPKQLALFKLLSSHSRGLSSQQLNEHMKNWRTAMKSLVNKDLVTERIDRPENLKSIAPARQLNSDQLQICNKISSDNKFDVHLLHGITGSGKTEIYITLCNKILECRKQVLIVVPEIGLTPQLLQRFELRFNVPVLSLHSGLADRERCNNWLQSAEDQSCIVIGTRSAAFAPMARLGLIIIDEEHDLSLKQQDGFRFSARDVLIKRAQNLNIPIVLGSATPSLESLAHAWQGKYQYHELAQRAGNAKPPQVEILDVRSQGLQDGLSNRLIADMRTTLAEGQQVLLFLNRRGYAPVLLCHDCGWDAHCERCNSHMSLFQGNRRLRCHHCDAQALAPEVCPVCQSDNLIAVGEGTERVESGLKECFPDTRILRIDRDSTRRKGSFQSMLDQIHGGEAQILLGTQMLAKGHDFPNVTLVGVLNTDQGLFSVDFRAIEHMGQLLIQVAGRAGRGEHPGKVIVQTHQPDHPLLLSLLHSGYTAFAKQLLEERQLAQLPPYGFLSLLRAESVQEHHAMEFLQQAKALLNGVLPSYCAVWGPAPAPMPKRAGRFRAQLLLHHQKRQGRTALLQQWITNIEELPMSRKVRWSVDVDPQNLY